MGYLSRGKTNKYRSAKRFKKQVSRTKAVNLRGVMRGGIRM
jgi:hypothetical protein